MVDNFANNFETTLTTGVDADDTAWTVGGSTGAPTVPFKCAVFLANAVTEIITVTAAVTTSWTVTRASESTAGYTGGQSHSAGAVIKHVLTADSLEEIYLDSVGQYFSAGGDLVIGSASYSSGNKSTSSAGATATASHTGTGNVSTLLDGTNNGEFGTGNSGENWIRINLAQSYNIESWRVFSNYNGYSRAVSLQWSNNNDNAGPWTTVDSASNATDTGTRSITAISKQYWRLLAAASSQEWYWATSNEIALNSTAGGGDPTQLTAGSAGTILRSQGSGSLLAWSHPRIPTKAGIPSDSDVLTTAADGMMILDTTNHRIYIRSGGTWKYVALT